jgi:SEC-C motif
MFILPDSLYDERQRLWREHEDGKLTDEVFYRQLLALDPDDYTGLAGLARVFRDAGDHVSAEQHYWLAIAANPCASSPYAALAQLLHSRPESKALADGLMELAILKQLREDDEDTLGALFLQMLEKTPMPAEAGEKLRTLSAGERGQLMTLALRENRDTEPEVVTAVLRLPRLIEDMLGTTVMDAGMVDSFIAEGERIAPLLTGVVRAWAQDFLGEDNDVDLENALGLLGETGTADEISCLLEFVDLENDVASGASSWALGRIMDRLPEEAARVLERMIPSLQLPQRLKIAELLVAHDRFDPENRLFRRLSEDLEVMEQDERDRYLPLLLASMAANPRRGGVGNARAILRTRGALVSRKARRECEELVSLFDGVEAAPMPIQPPAPTIYEICAGDAVWDSDEDEDEEADDDFLPAPEPIRRTPAPGRNDPCWCNSGKKYKKCHLESDERENRQPTAEGSFVRGGRNEFAKLRQSIGEFLGQVLRRGEMKDAVAEFFRDRAEADTADDELSITEWMIHDWIAPRLGRTVLEQFLIERGARLTEREREMAAAWSRSFVGLYEIQQLKPGSGAELREVVSGETFFVHDVSLSGSAVKWDGLLTRVVPGERGLELAAVGQRVPRTHLNRLREWMEDDRDEQGLAWPEYLKANWPRIRRQTFNIAEDWLDGLRLTNNSGEELLFSKAVYDVLDEPKVIEALRRSAEFTEDSREDEARKSFVWLNDKQTVLGTIHMVDGQLVFECNSKQRHERGQRMIAELAGAGVRHLRDEFTTQKEMKRRVKESPRDRKDTGAELPAEERNEILAKFGEQHYVEWLDTSVPGLGGKTPRQAAKTAKGRQQLVEILKFVENTEDRKRQRGEPFIEAARMRADLGLD